MCRPPSTRNMHWALSQHVCADYGLARDGCVSPVFVVSRRRLLDVGGCLPVLECISQNVRHVSEMPRRANLLKLCGNFPLLSAVETLAEVFALLAAEGVVPSVFLGAMHQALLRMPFYQSYGRRMTSGEFSPG